MKFGFPDMRVDGTGGVRNKPLTGEQLAGIRMRADMIDDMQIRNDTFALIAEVEMMRSEIVKIMARQKVG